MRERLAGFTRSWAGGSGFRIGLLLIRDGERVEAIGRGPAVTFTPAR